MNADEILTALAVSDTLGKIAEANHSYLLGMIDAEEFATRTSDLLVALDKRWPDSPAPRRLALLSLCV